MRIKNWNEFQHFKDRTPPWIKLYRYLLDDPDWHSLSGDEAKTLIMLWLVASEDKQMEGNLPPVKNIAFRFRISEKELNQRLNKLSNWLILDDNEVISSCYQDDIPEERQRQRQSRVKKSKLTFDISVGWLNYSEFVSKAESDYPNVDILKEMDKASRWIKEKPSQRTKADYNRFMNNWLSRVNESAPNSNDIFAGAI